MNWGIKVLQTSALPLGYAAKSTLRYTLIYVSLVNFDPQRGSSIFMIAYLTFGAENEIRTRDPRLGKAMLYH